MVKKSSKVKSNVKVRNKKLNKLNKGKRKGNKKTRKFEEASKKVFGLKSIFKEYFQNNKPDRYTVVRHLHRSISSGLSLGWDCVLVFVEYILGSVRNFEFIV
jgi:hypothetical protein